MFYPAATNFFLMDVTIEQSWKEELKEEFSKPYFEHIVQFMKRKRKQVKLFTLPANLFSMLLKVRHSAK